MKELDKDLEKISGGASSERTMGNYVLTEFVPASQVEAGHRYYFADNRVDAWYEAYVTKTSNKKYGCSTTKYYEVEEFASYYGGKETSSHRLVTEYVSNNYDAYRYMTMK